MSLIQRRTLVLLVLTICGMTLTSCSAGKPAIATTSGSRSAAVPPSYISPGDILAQPAGGPSRTVLIFWQDIQLQDFPGALELLSRPFAAAYARDLDHFASYVSAEQARWMVKPTVESTSVTGRGARVLIDYPFGGTTARTVFDLKRQNNSWAISYNFYLINRLTARPAATSGAARH